jgi:hypothetical protein
MSDAETKRDREIAERARQLFAESVAGLDGHTRSRLARARAKAVEAVAGRRSRWLAPSTLVPLGGVAAAALVAGVLWHGPGTTVAPVEPTMANDLDLLLDGENLDLYEDLEFYAWLLDQPELQDADDAGDGSG